MIVNQKTQKMSMLFDKIISSNSKRFICKYKDKCKFNIKNEACHTGYFGDDNSKVMLIAEAPSTSGGKGVFRGGNTKNITRNKKSELYDLIEFIKKEYGYYPYFTDAIKCGVAKQNNKGNILKIRKKYCVEYLLKEILIMNPDEIICIGNMSKKIINENKDKIIRDLNKEVKIRNLIHYSKQGSLPLHIEDKKNIIWRIQCGKLSKKEIEKTSILNLKSIERYFKNNS